MNGCLSLFGLRYAFIYVVGVRFIFLGEGSVGFDCGGWGYVLESLCDCDLEEYY